MQVMLSHYLPILLFLLAGAIISVKANKLTLAGGISGALVGLFVFAGTDYAGMVMLTTFFVLGTLATSWRKDEKAKFKSADDRAIKRTSGQVLANGGMAAICGLLALLIPSHSLLLGLMLAAALASATADTLSSELGTIYGRRFFNIISFKKEAKGLDGVISIEGLIIGVIGSALIGGIYSFANGLNTTFLYIVIAGTAGNIADSILGALLERRGYLKNDMVNFLNTLVAAIVVGGLCLT